MLMRSKLVQCKVRSRALARNPNPTSFLHVYPKNNVYNHLHLSNTYEIPLNHPYSSFEIEIPQLDTSDRLPHKDDPWKCSLKTLHNHPRCLQNHQRRSRWCSRTLRHMPLSPLMNLSIRRMAFGLPTFTRASTAPSPTSPQRSTTTEEVTF
jgi:hypothetical protein